MQNYIKKILYKLLIFFYFRLRWLKTTQIEILWNIPSDAPKGVYRIRHFGKYKAKHGFRSYEIRTSVFRIV